jgi:CheY-like chemotaxis protein
MPNVSGVELIRRVRSDPKLEKIPIIAVSASRYGLLEEAEEAGATEVIEKPLDFDELMKLLNKYVPTHAPMSDDQS